MPCGVKTMYNFGPTLVKKVHTLAKEASTQVRTETIKFDGVGCGGDLIYIILLPLYRLKDANMKHMLLYIFLYDDHKR